MIDWPTQTSFATLSTPVYLRTRQIPLELCGKMLERCMISKILPPTIFGFEIA